MKTLPILTACTMLIAMPAAAQQTGETEAAGALREAFTAEHEAWEEDTERWREQHDEAMAILEEVYERFTQERMLDHHLDAMDDHAETLREVGLSELAARHARVRSAHEEMREAHHHLMDAIAMLEKAVDEDLGPMSRSKDDTRRRERNRERH